LVVNSDQQLSKVPHFYHQDRLDPDHPRDTFRGMTFVNVVAARVAFGVWAVALWLISAVPAGPPTPSILPHQDKILHFGYYALGGFLLIHALGPIAARLGRSAPVVCIAFLALIGGLDEFHQTFVPGRSGLDPGDWLADTLGAAAGVLAWTFLARTMRKQR